MRRLLSVLLVLGLPLIISAPGVAQETSRVGVGVQVLGSTADNNVGPGVRVRVSKALNQDVSIAIGSGITGYIFRGRDDAAFALDPQISGIVSFSSKRNESTYVLGGAGAYVPFGESTANSGPTFHLGAGRAWLLKESSLFFEFNPGFLVGKEKTTLVLPLRIGIIL